MGDRMLVPDDPRLTEATVVLPDDGRPIFEFFPQAADGATLRPAQVQYFSAQFGPYELLYPLGSGGMGEVFLARQRGEHGIQRVVAVKRMLLHTTKRSFTARVPLSGMVR